MKKRLISVLAALGVCMTMLSSAAMCAGAANYTETAGSEQTFYKYLVLDSDANIPNATFSYTIEPGTAIAGTADNMQVFAGKTATVSSVTYPKIADVVYTAGETGAVGGAADDGIANSAEKKYLRHDIKVDFANVKFDEPGVYRYTVTEDLNGSQGIAVSGAAAKTLDVFVEDDNGSLKVSSYVLYNTVIDTAPAKDNTIDADASADKNAADGSKTDGFVNTYTTYDLTFDKTVTGNQGSKDKYFAFTVEISGAVAGTKYDVDLSDADASISANPNSATTCITEAVTQPGQLTVGPNGTVKQTYYLRHGQSVTVKGLAENTSYTITEAQEDYKPETALEDGSDTKTADGTADEAVIAVGADQNTVSDSAINADTTVKFTNDRSGMIPTGVLLSVAAPVIFCAVMFGGIVLLIVKKMRKRTQED